MSLKQSLQKGELKMVEMQDALKVLDDGIVSSQNIGIHIKPIEIDREKTKIEL